jgi:hypothetical protein
MYRNKCFCRMRKRHKRKTKTQDETVLCRCADPSTAAAASASAATANPTATTLRSERRAQREWLQVRAKTHLFAPLPIYKCSFYQDRLGTNIGKALRKVPRFLAAATPTHGRKRTTPSPTHKSLSSFPTPKASLFCLV